MRDLGDLPAWLDAYLDLPFVEGGRSRAGVDCYGLLRLVLAERFGCDIPEDPAGARRAGMDRASVAGLAARIEAARAEWRELRRDDIRPGAAILLRVEGRPLHVGVVLNDRAFLHAEPGAGVHAERWDGARWASRVLGFYAWTPR